MKYDDMTSVADMSPFWNITQTSAIITHTWGIKVELKRKWSHRSGFMKIRRAS